MRGGTLRDRRPGAKALPHVRPTTADIMPFTPRVFSGTQPSGDLHLGNYLGAIKRYVEMQKTHECIYCVVDMHAITVWQEPDDLRRATREVAAAYVAAGVDPKKNIVFNQSRVHQHAELAWVFNCVARMGWMNRMTQWKDKTAGKNAESGFRSACSPIPR